MEVGAYCPLIHKRLSNLFWQRSYLEYFSFILFLQWEDVERRGPSLFMSVVCVFLKSDADIFELRKLSLKMIILITEFVLVNLEIFSDPDSYSAVNVGNAF